MKVTSRAHYGLRIMTELARAYGGGAVSLAEIARHQRLPQGYLEQLILPLRRAGLVVGTRGAHGGYRLSRAPAEITAGEAVRALEGPLALVDCLCDDYQSGACTLDTSCASRPLWLRVRQSINQVLDSTSLADLCMEPGRGTVAPLNVAGKGAANSQGKVG